MILLSKSPQILLFLRNLIKLVRHQQEHFDSAYHGYVRVGNHAVASFWGPSLTVSKLLWVAWRALAAS